MAPRTDLVLVLDLETSGSEPDICEIIEVGAVMLSLPDLTELGAFRATVGCTALAIRQIMDNAVVKRMHEENGLLDELTPGLSLKEIERIDRDFVEWMKSIAGLRTDHIPLSGSGVSHFDRQFIKRHMPLLHRRVTYWAYDVGVVRRLFELVGLPWLPEAKNHRALDDARYHADELRFGVAALRRLKEAELVPA